MHKILFLGMVLLASLALMSGQVSEHPAPADAAKPETESARMSEARTISNGIQIHGHWLIEILEPDGSTHSVHEFENALVGHGYITGLLTRSADWGSCGGWIVGLGTYTGPCGQACGIAEPGLVSCSGYHIHSSNLAVTRTSAGMQTIHMVGSVVATTSAQFAEVHTYIKYCEHYTLPVDCLSRTAGTGGCYEGHFTTASISPIDVIAGQQILVTVDITFS